MLRSLALIVLVALALAAFCQTICLPRIIDMQFTSSLLGPYVLGCWMILFWGSRSIFARSLCL